MISFFKKNIRKAIIATFALLPFDFANAQNGLLVDCATTKQGCNNINSLLDQAILVGKYLLGISGSLALLAFVYGGGVMLTSFGNADRFKEGRTILTSAVIGLLIAFGAYFIVDLVLQAIGAGGIGGL